MQEETEEVIQEAIEEAKEGKHTLSSLTVKIKDKINELSKLVGERVGEKKEYAQEKINENPFAYLAGAFFGGMVMGYMMNRRKS